MLAESAVFGGRVCPSHLYRPATSLRSAPSLACSWGFLRCAVANNWPDAHRHRTASESCFLGAMAYCRTHTSSSESYRERNRLRKRPERTNGTPKRASVCVPSSAAFGEQSPKARASERNASYTRTVDHVFSTGPGPARPQPVSAHEVTATSNKPSKERQSVIDKTSTKHQPGVNGTPTKRQPVINETSTERQIEDFLDENGKSADGLINGTHREGWLDRLR